MKFTQAFLPLVLSGVALAKPTPVLEERAVTTICGQWDSVVTGSYIVYQDLWNETSASSGQSKINLLVGNNSGKFPGSQCTTVESLSGTTLTWSTQWSWAGASNQVKSYANVVYKQSTIKKVSAISTIPTTWKWR